MLENNIMYIMCNNIRIILIARVVKFLKKNVLKEMIVHVNGIQKKINVQNPDWKGTSFICKCKNGEDKQCKDDKTALCYLNQFPQCISKTSLACN